MFDSSRPAYRQWYHEVKVGLDSAAAVDDIFYSKNALGDRSDRDFAAHIVTSMPNSR
jgi:hypothetical protein